MFTNIYHFDYYYFFLLFFFSTLKPLKKNEMKWIYFRSIQSNRLRINKRCLIICFKSSLGLGLGQDSFFSIILVKEMYAIVFLTFCK